MSRNRIKIAIDGPAGSGKSTTAKEVAKRLGYVYIDSGAMYRAVTLNAIERNIPTTDDKRMVEIAANTRIEFKTDNSQTIILMEGRDVSNLIRTPEVNNRINPVAANPEVRRILVKKQQELGKDGGIVMDGRDIGTVVFPDAELKIYMEASAEERAKRRFLEFKAKGIGIEYEEVLEEIKTRDRADTSRKHGPLRVAPDAVVLDTTNLSVDEQVEKVLELAKERQQEKR